jgi:hypothetical protein
VCLSKQSFYSIVFGLCLIRHTFRKSAFRMPSSEVVFTHLRTGIPVDRASVHVSYLNFFFYLLHRMKNVCQGSADAVVTTLRTGLFSILQNIKTSFGTHPASCSLRTTRVVSCGGGVNGWGVKLSTHLHILLK